MSASHRPPDIFETEGDRPRILALWLPERPPTNNGVNKQHPQTRGRTRREWKAVTERAIARALSAAPTVKAHIMKAWTEGTRIEREALLGACPELRARCFGEVDVFAQPYYVKGRSVPDTDGVTTAVKWSLDSICDAGCLVTDQRHHVVSINVQRARIEPMLHTDGGLRIIVEEAFSQ